MLAGGFDTLVGRDEEIGLLLRRWEQSKLEQALQRTSLSVEETVPLFAALLSLPVPDGRYPALTFSPQ